MKKNLTKYVGQYFSKIFFFKQSLILSGYTFSWFLFCQPLLIFVVLNFSKKAAFKNACCFFILGLKLFWSRVQQNHPDEKSVGDFQSWESNRGQQWLSRTGQIKICQDFCWVQNFYWFLREKMDLFDRTSNGVGSLLEKTEIRPLWSIAAGDKEVAWLQKTNLGFHTRRIPFWRNLRPFLFL